jgi:hypothetical protein
VLRPAAKAPQERTAPAAQFHQQASATMPGHAAMAGAMISLWKRCAELDNQAGEYREVGQAQKGEGAAIGSSQLFEQVLQLTDYALTVRPATAADAVAHLVMLHADLFDSISSSSDASLSHQLPRLELAVHSLAILGKLAGFDIVPLVEEIMRGPDALIARGEVPA